MEAAGYEVGLAGSAGGKLHTRRGSARTGLFIVDIEMPGMNGFRELPR